MPGSAIRSAFEALFRSTSAPAFDADSVPFAAVLFCVVVLLFDVAVAGAAFDADFDLLCALAPPARQSNAIRTNEIMRLCFMVPPATSGAYRASRMNAGDGRANQGGK